jgi:hypothetical protein
MTLAQYQRIHEINQTTLDNIERIAFTICYLFDKSEEYVNELTTERFTRYIDKLNRALQIKKPWVHLITFESDATKITLGQFIECQYWLKHDPIQSIHLIGASILKKREDHIKDAEVLLTVEVNQILPAVEIFIKSFKALIASYKGLFGEPLPEGEESEKPHVFIDQYGWIFSAKQVADHNGITIDQAYELPVIHALNDMSYLKSKQQYDKWLAKQ